MVEIDRRNFGNKPVLGCGIRIDDERGEPNQVVGDVPLFADRNESGAVHRRIGNPDGLSDGDFPKAIPEIRIDDHEYAIGLIVHIIEWNGLGVPNIGESTLALVGGFHFHPTSSDRRRVEVAPQPW